MPALTSYPRVLSEDETLDLCRTKSIARFGDGELRLTNGKPAKSQDTSAGLAKEFRELLAVKPGGDCLVAIPHINATPKVEAWKYYLQAHYTRYMKAEWYGSAFITRPDSAPWIDRPDYWGKVIDLWRGKEVTLVAGDRKSLTPELMAEASSVRVVSGPTRNAYAAIDGIEEEVGKPSGPVILCLGATATALASRLSKKGVHALDLGHIGMFMKHMGAYSVPVDKLISRKYRDLNREMHDRPAGFGGSGWKHAETVFKFAGDIGAQSILDYGCGEGTLRKSLEQLGWKRFIGEYDPGIVKKSVLPKPADLVVCTDVMEHIEPAYIDNVLSHIHKLAGIGCFMAIATRPANKMLPNGENAHLTIEGAEWWKRRLAKAAGWSIDRMEEKRKGDGSPHDVRFWLLK